MERRKSDLFRVCMIIGRNFRERYGRDNRTSDWSATTECSTFTKMVLDLMHTSKQPASECVDEVIKSIFENGFSQIEDHAWDDICRGFLAGEILGDPTPQNMERLKKLKNFGKMQAHMATIKSVLKR